MTQGCECHTWARTDGRVTNHHPDCEKFEEERFVRITLEHGGTYIQPEAELGVLLDEIKDADVGAKWTLELIEMTREEHDRLPEFEGH